MTVYDDSAGLVGREIDDPLLRVRGLVLVRSILAQRGASRDELDAHAKQLERVRRRLADLFRGERSA